MYRASDFQHKTIVTPAKEWQVEHAPHVQGSLGERSDLQLGHHLPMKFRVRVMDSRLRGNDEVLVLGGEFELESDA